MKEDLHTEFKSKFNDAVIETLVAFANTKGGKVLVGIDDEGEPLKSFSLGKESIQQWINEIKNKHQKVVEKVVEKGRRKGRRKPEQKSAYNHPAYQYELAILK